MKIQLSHHSVEQLPYDIERPGTNPPGTGTVVRVHRNASGSQIALKFMSGGTGVWESTGRLLYYLPQGADMAWLGESSTLLSLECKFGKCQQREGVGHVLKWLEGGSFRTTEEREICVPTGFVEYLVVNRQASQCLATWRDAAEWGYVRVDLTTKSQMPGGFSYPHPNTSPPEFSPDGRFIVSCNPVGFGWWTDQDDGSPSPGGLRQTGIVAVQDLLTDTITHHEVTVMLPAGWVPDHPDYSEWSQLWGPEFISDREFRFWLPDDSVEFVRLPLPPCIEIHRNIAFRRAWPDED